jgi:predicted XRE-type DNA-binding protein
LREIRKVQRDAERLTRERDRLVRAAGARFSERQIASASGLSQSRVHELLNGD